MLRKLVDKVGENPIVFNTARRVFEANFNGEKKVIKKELGVRPGKVLDVPSGTGEFSFLFQEEDYTGVDLEPGYVDYAVKKHRKRFLVMDATNMSFPANHFDAILIVGFFHHLTDEQIGMVLRESKRVLKEGGKLLLIEDAPTRNKLNFIGRLGQKYDRGANIRDADFYAERVGRLFDLKKCYPMRSGCWDYGVFVGVK